MERIHLTKKEKIVLRHVAEKGGEGPWELPMLQVKCALYRLREKGLIYYILNFDEAVDARLTLKGRSYLELNPGLKNPINWKLVCYVVLFILYCLLFVASFIK